jgi:hypothetical protein
MVTPGSPVTLEAVRGYFPDLRLANRLQPLPEHNLIYVRNAKAGTSTLLLWLSRLHTGEHGATPSRESIRTETLPRPGDVGWPAVLAMLSGEAFRFSFVRDPIRRAESAYLDKIARAPRTSRRRDIQRTLGLPEDPEQVPTFDEFVSALELQQPLRMNPHWRPQHLNLMHGLVEYDLVGRLESFDADLARLQEMAGLPVVPTERRNVAPPADAGPTDRRPDLVRRLCDVYARDLELYGY